MINYTCWRDSVPLLEGTLRTKALFASFRFVLNGLINANQILGEEVFKLEDWRIIGEYVYDEEGGRHQGNIWPAMSVRHVHYLLTRYLKLSIRLSKTLLC